MERQSPQLVTHFNLIRFNLNIKSHFTRTNFVIIIKNFSNKNSDFVITKWIRKQYFVSLKTKGVLLVKRNKKVIVEMLSLVTRQV